MAKNFIQPGKVISFTPQSAVVSGQVVVIGQVLGVALTDIAGGVAGEAQVDGVFEVPKVTGAVFGIGESLTWDVSAGKFDDNAAVAATGDITGPAAVAFKAGADGEATALVKFTGVPGTKA